MRQTVTKQYRDLPAAHRAFKHDGHCRFIHGHSFGVDFVFTAEAPDKSGFLVDFGKLKWLQSLLDRMFDHKLILSKDDPDLFMVHELQQRGLVDIVTIDEASCEGMARHLFTEVSAGIQLHMSEAASRGAVLLSVTVHEDSRNSATITRDDK